MPSDREKVRAINCAHGAWGCVYTGAKEKECVEFLLSDRTNPSGAHDAQPNRAAPSADGRSLEVTLDNNAAFSLDAGTLRAACLCAHCRRAQIEGVFAPELSTVAIAYVTPIGHYAVNLAFSDGHARGIYPWSYLAELSAGSSLR